MEHMQKNQKIEDIHFSEAEYNTLREETITRITLINQQASTAIVTIISVWAAGIGMLVMISGKEIADTYSILGLNFVNACIFLVPIFYFIPLAIKSGENLKQLAAISAYIKVFYDSLSVRNSKDLMNWETSNYLLGFLNTKNDKNNLWVYFYNEEYTILAFFSYVFYVIWSWMAYGKCKSLYVTCSERYIYLTIFIVLGIIGVLAIAIIYRESSAQNAIVGKTQYYIEKYAEYAYILGVLSREETDCLKRKFLRKNIKNKGE